MKWYTPIIYSLFVLTVFIAGALAQKHVVWQASMEGLDRDQCGEVIRSCSQYYEYRSSSSTREI